MIAIYLSQPAHVVPTAELGLLIASVLLLLALHTKALKMAAALSIALVLARITYIVCLGCCTYFWCKWV